MAVKSNKTRQMISVHKSAWVVISQFAKCVKMTPSDLIEEIVMSKIANDLEAYKKAHSKKGRP